MKKKSRLGHKIDTTSFGAEIVFSCNIWRNFELGCKQVIHIVVLYSNEM